MNLWQLISEQFSARGNFIALLDQQQNPITYAELLKLAYNVANVILTKADSGKKVAVLNENPVFDVIGVLGVLAAGCIVIPMSLKYGEATCIKIIENSAPNLLLTDIGSLPGGIVEAATNTDTIIINEQEFGKADVLIKEIDYNEEIAMIMHTSGTTGKPKGVMLTHENFIANLKGIAAYFKLGEDDTILIARPLYHAAVMTGEFLHSLISGARIAFYYEAFSPKRLITFMNKVGCTVMCATPTLFYHLAVSVGNIEATKLRLAVVSGECLQPQVAKTLVDSFPNTSFFNVYGLTEASPRVSYLTFDYFTEKIGSVGIPLYNVKIKIDDDDGKEVKAMQIGEILVKGPNVMKGYWNDEVETLNRLRSGWLHTGDLAYLDEQGFLFILGRKDNMIIRAGVNIYPQEIENALLCVPGIAEALAWGEVDLRYGQSICLAVVLDNKDKLTVAEISAICRKKLPPYQCPDSVVIVECLQKNASGKVLRNANAIAQLLKNIK